MATIRKEFVIDGAPEKVWDAMRDVGALHTRLVPGFVTDCKLEGDARIVSATGPRLSHHNASSRVFAEGGKTKVVWIADLLPNEMKPAIAGMIDAGASAMQKALGGK